MRLAAVLRGHLETRKELLDNVHNTSDARPKPNLKGPTEFRIPGWWQRQHVHRGVQKGAK
jgi:hypothetical protein